MAKLTMPACCRRGFERGSSGYRAAQPARILALQWTRSNRPADRTSGRSGLTVELQFHSPEAGIAEKLIASARLLGRIPGRTADRQPQAWVVEMGEGAHGRFSVGEDCNLILPASTPKAVQE
jgi:hypothetical protein